MRAKLKKRQWRRWMTLCGCLALGILSACNPLRPTDQAQPALLPTRTLAPVRTVPAESSATITPEVTDKPAAGATSATPLSDAATSPAAVTDTPLPTRVSSFALCTQTRPSISPTTPATSGTGQGQIVLVGLDGNVALSDGTGTSVQTVTTDANVDPDKGLLRAYTYPVFSGDGKDLAFVSYSTISGTDTITQTLFIAPAAPKANLTRLYTTTADNIPYLDWSPDNKTIAFLTISSGKGALRTVDATGGNPTLVEEGSSVYWHWRNDSAALLAHLSGSPASNADAHISLVGAPSNQPQVARISSVPGNFKSPHYSPDARHMLFVVRTNDNDDLVLADASGKPLCSVAALDVGASFAWSPDGAHIAWIDSAVPTSKPAALHVLNLATGMETTPYDQALAFFWSPDSRRLAVYTAVQNSAPTSFGAAHAKLDRPISRPAAQTSNGTTVLRIEIMQVDTSSKVLVADTIPTRAMVALLDFFDQYARALTPWSPDGQQLVFTSSSTTQPTVDVVVAALNSSSNQVNLRRITSGLVAFWSPR